MNTAKVKEFFSGELSLENTEAMHYRIYRFWYMHTSRKDRDKTKDFCFYSRIIMFWAPMLWFFKVPLFSWVRPWMLALVAFLATFTGVSFWLWPAEALKVLLIMGITLLGLAALVGLAILLTWLEDVNKDALFWIAAVVFSPIWIPIFIVVWPLDQLHNFLSRKGAYRWFFLTRKWWVISPWSITLLALIALSFLTLGSHITWLVLEVIGVIALIIAVLIAAIALIFLVVDLIQTGVRNWRRRNAARRHRQQVMRTVRTEPVEKPKGSSTVQVVGHVIMAKKRKICPLIKLPDDPKLRRYRQLEPFFYEE